MLLFVKRADRTRQMGYIQTSPSMLSLVLDCLVLRLRNPCVFPHILGTH